MGAVPISTLHEASVLEEYFIICNAVLKASAGRFPYEQVWKACAETFQGKKLIVKLDDHPNSEMLSICFHLGRFHWRPLNKLQEKTTIKYLTMNDVKPVLEDPEAFIKKPYLMNWDWLKI